MSTKKRVSNESGKTQGDAAIKALLEDLEWRRIPQRFASVQMAIDAIDALTQQLAQLQAQNASLRDQLKSAQRDRDAWHQQAIDRVADWKKCEEQREAIASRATAK